MRALCLGLSCGKLLAEVRRVEYRPVRLRLLLEHVHKLIRQRQNARLAVLGLHSKQSDLLLLQVNLREAVVGPHDLRGFPDAHPSVVQQGQQRP